MVARVTWPTPLTLDRIGDIDSPVAMEIRLVQIWQLEFIDDDWESERMNDGLRGRLPWLSDLIPGGTVPLVHRPTLDE